jgi:hypothetical protein
MARDGHGREPGGRWFVRVVVRKLQLDREHPSSVGGRLIVRRVQSRDEQLRFMTSLEFVASVAIVV